VARALLPAAQRNCWRISTAAIAIMLDNA
jgi:hypothetical protein